MLDGPLRSAGPEATMERYRDARRRIFGEDQERSASHGSGQQRKRGGKGRSWRNGEVERKFEGGVKPSTPEPEEEETPAVTLSLDEIPYDRNLKYINVASDQRARPELERNRIFSQAMAMASGPGNSRTVSRGGRGRARRGPHDGGEELLLKRPGAAHDEEGIGSAGSVGSAGSWEKTQQQQGQGGQRGSGRRRRSGNSSRYPAAAAVVGHGSPRGALAHGVRLYDQTWSPQPQSPLSCEHSQPEDEGLDNEQLANVIGSLRIDDYSDDPISRPNGRHYYHQQQQQNKKAMVGAAARLLVAQQALTGPWTVPVGGAP